MDFFRKADKDREKLNEFEMILESQHRHSLDHEEMELLNRALIKLTLEQREVVILKVYEQMTFRKIAEILRIPHNTVASRYRYALDKMRTFLINREENNGKEHQENAGESAAENSAAGT